MSWTISLEGEIFAQDKIGFGCQEFLREVYEKCEDNKELQEKSEEGFLFLTDRSNCSFFNVCSQIGGVANSEAGLCDKRRKSCRGWRD